MTENCSKNIMDKSNTNSAALKCSSCGDSINMVNGKPMRINPDSLTGMIFAMEGIKNTVVMLNGPMGCKFYHSTTSQFLSIRPNLQMPIGPDGKKAPVDYNYLNDWFFRQQRVPCSYLDGYDYVYGTAEKITEGLEFLKKNVAFDLLAIVNSPGASLIGDNLLEISRRVLGDQLVVMLESPGYSEEVYDGYSTAFVEMIKQVGSRLWKKSDAQAAHQSEQASASAAASDSAEVTWDAGLENSSDDDSDTCLKEGESSLKHGKSVNLLGLSIWNRYMEGDREELKRLLALNGIQVNCCPFAENSMEEFQKLPEADLNVVIDPLYALEAAKLLKEMYDMPYYVCDSLPIGFKATHKMMKEICECLCLSLSQEYLTQEEKARALCYLKIRDIYQMCGLPKGASFAVEGSSSQQKAYGAFFEDYLGMVAKPLEKAELVFGDANVISQLKLLEHGNHVFCGIEINLPGMGYVDITPKTHYGIQGAMFLTEQVLNGLMSKI